LGQLLDELPSVRPLEVVGANSSLGENEAISGLLSAEDEALVTTVRATLATIAAAVNEGRASDGARQAALDGTEMVMRGELVIGRRDNLARLMPSLVFLVALPNAGQDRALALSRRTSELLAED
jgi:hypothetical protein